MPVPRRIAIACVLTVTVAAPLVPGSPAGAHGATSDPISRAVACAPDAGRTARSAACRAAVAVSGEAFQEWDNIRVAGVNGRDRQRIPDGRLCSGGLTAYHGLDLARADWPATTVQPGARFTFRYRQRIPHQGTFRLYVTRAGYDPTEPLRWSDLESRPFLTVADPPMRGGAYVFSGRFPGNRTGRQLILAIWQNSDTPDTYYSCSDVVFAAKRAAGAGKATATARPRTAEATAGGATPAASAGTAPAAGDQSVDTEPVAGTDAIDGTPPTPGPGVALLLVGLSLGLATVAGAAIVWRRRQRW